MSEHEQRTVFAPLTSTQRLTIGEVMINGNDPRVELRKEWRRSVDHEWMASKGITIPYMYLQSLIELLGKFHQLRGNKGDLDGGLGKKETARMREKTDSTEFKRANSEQ